MNHNNSFARLFASPHGNAPSEKFRLFTSAALIGFTCLIAGCANPPFGQPASHAVFQQQPTRIVKVTAVGYGASSSYDGYTTGQKRLMAMRTSKLDAYRALAEQVQGVRVNGNSTVAAMVAQVDSYRVYVDAYLRGVQVVTVTPMENGNYETTMELTLDDQFFGMFEQPAKIGSQVINSASLKGASGPGYAYGSNFYYSK